MKTRDLRSVIPFIILIVLFSSCEDREIYSTSDGINQPILETTPFETANISGLVETNVSCVSNVQIISPDRIWQFKLLENESDIIFEDTDQFVWKYNLESKETEFLYTGKIQEDDFIDLSAYQNLIPENYVVMFVSSSIDGESVLIFAYNEINESDIQENSEMLINETLIVFLSTAGGFPQIIGEIPNDLNYLNWAPGDEKVFLSMGNLNPFDVKTWLIDISSFSINPFPIEDVQIYGISPAGRWMIAIQENGNLLKINLEDFTAAELPIKILSPSHFWWETENSLIYLSRNYFQGDVRSYLMSYDFTTNQIIKLFEEKLNVNLLMPDTAELSIDGNYLLFIDKDQKLNVINICEK